MRRFLLLSVHYRHPELLADQIDRLRRCAAPVRSVLDAELLLLPILHRWAAPSVVEAVLDAGDRHRELVRPVDLREREAEEIPEDVCHGHSLAAACRRLAGEGRLGGEDLVGSLDHDVHPLHAEAFAWLGSRLLEADGIADVTGVGIPQWHRGHCYLHPSLLLTRAATLEGMGFDTAFELRSPAANGRKWSDTGEGFTIWCEGNGRAVLPLRVESTEFPWSRWDSNMAPGGGTELTGWHGEAVRVGSLMRYGLSPGEPLVSHLWAGPLDPYRWMGFSDRTWDETLTAYLAEPLARAD